MITSATFRGYGTSSAILSHSCYHRSTPQAGSLCTAAGKHIHYAPVVFNQPPVLTMLIWHVAGDIFHVCYACLPVSRRR